MSRTEFTPALRSSGPTGKDLPSQAGPQPQADRDGHPLHVDLAADQVTGEHHEVQHQISMDSRRIAPARVTPGCRTEEEAVNRRGREEDLVSTLRRERRGGGKKERNRQLELEPKWLEP